jgi:hypothetical protein
MVIGFLAHTAPAAGADLDTLRTLWQNAQTPDQYTVAVKALIEYRKAARFAKTPEIDYMIAAGLCRIPGHEGDGQRHFLWIIENFSLGADRETILGEQRLCGGQTAPQRIAFAMTPGQSGPAGIHSKLFYWLGREAIAVSSEPVEVVEQKDPKDLRARLFDPEALPAAEAAARDRLGDGFTVAGGDGFIVASATGYTPPDLQEIAGKLGQFASFYVGAYGMRSPPKLVTVYLAPDPDVMGKLALKLHGLKIPESMIGYSYVDDLSMLGIVREKAIGTLGHELFHLMVRDQDGDLPPWLEEGIAALYESSNIAEKYLPGGPSGAVTGEVPMVGGDLAVRGLPNWRGCVLEKLWLEHFNGIQVERPKLAELAAMDWTAFNNSGPGDESDDQRAAQQAVNHATARYLMLYLQDQDQKLFSVFHSFATRDPFAIQVPPEEDAKQRLAEQLGPLDRADAAFENWLRGVLPTQACAQG